jgi:hypothetical protein
MKRFRNRVRVRRISSGLHSRRKSRTPIAFVGMPAGVEPDPVDIIGKNQWQTRIDRRAPWEALRVRTILTQMRGG